MKEISYRKRIELGHGGQILTTRRTIIEFIWDNEMPITDNTIFLIALEEIITIVFVPFYVHWF